MNSLNDLLKRSAELEEVLLPFLALPPANSTDKLVSSRIMCGVSFEHAESAKILTAAGNFTSALSIVRLQYEALVRAMWLLYAASDTAVTKLMVDLSQDTAKKADQPMLSEMLKELDGKAPPVAVSQLLEIKEYHWKPLSSYVHGGIHALHRHSKGYPEPLLLQIIKTSNAFSVMAAMHLVMLSGDANQSGKIPKIQQGFANCLPDLNNSVS